MFGLEGCNSKCFEQDDKGLCKYFDVIEVWETSKAGVTSVNRFARMKHKRKLVLINMTVRDILSM